MKCEKHPEIEASAVCVNCGNALCQDCSVKVGGKNYCKDCADNLIINKEENKNIKGKSGINKGIKIVAAFILCFITIILTFVVILSTVVFFSDSLFWSSSAVISSTIFEIVIWIFFIVAFIMLVINIKNSK